MRFIWFGRSGRVGIAAWAVTIAALIAGFGSSIASAGAADDIAIATITTGRLFVLGTTSEPHQRVVLDGRFETISDDASSFHFELVYHPATCIVGATIGNEKREAVVSHCGQRDEKADVAAVDARGEQQASVQAPPPSPEPPRPQVLPVASQAQGLAALPAPEAREPDAKPPVAAPAAPEPASAPPAMTRAPWPPSRPSEAKLRTAQATHDERIRHRPAPTSAIKPAAESGAETADRKGKQTSKPSEPQRKPAPAKAKAR